MDNSIIDTVIAAISSVLAVGATGVAAALRKQLAPQRARHSMRICIVCAAEQTEPACSLRSELQDIGYEHVSLTHAAPAADADCVILWRWNKDEVVERVTQLRAVAPLGYLVVFTQDRVDGLNRVDDRTLVVNSRLRLLSDVETVATAYGARKR